MSIKSKLVADLNRIGFGLSGSHLTREARTTTFNTFAKTMQVLGYGIQRADQIGGRHLTAYVAARGPQVSPRTLANELAHLRAVLIHIGKEGLARNPEYGNRALGIERGSRIGTKQPLSNAAIQTFRARMDQLGRSGIGATLELQRALGLREAEAVRAGQIHTLSRWERELSAKRCIRVVEGTKGNRPRHVHPADQARAVSAIRSAQAILRDSGQRFLVTRADGTAAANLKQAMSIYKNLCVRERVQSHAARYSFARERLEAYKAEGFSEREALAATALDLGHGDGRGRFIASVYAREE